MKTLKINDRGIKIIENGEIINQGLFTLNEDIPKEVFELLSIYDKAEEIFLKIELEIPEEILDEIKLVVINKGWKIKQDNIFPKINLIAGIFLSFEIILGLILFFKNYRLEHKNLRMKKEKAVITQKIDEINTKIKELPKFEKTSVNFQKIKIGKILKNLLNTCKILEINLEKVEFIENKIQVTGYGTEIEKIFKLKEFIVKDQIESAKFDFIRNEGEFIYFLIELERY